MVIRLKKRTNGRASKELARRGTNGPHRRHKRFRTQSLLIDNPVVGRVVNVGQSGFAVETLAGLAVGQSYIFKVRLGEKHLRLAGRVQWCRLTTTESDGADESLPVYRTGVALAETVASRAWQEALKRLTEEPAYLIWHRARAKSTALEELAGIEPAASAAEESSDQLAS